MTSSPPPKDIAIPSPLAAISLKMVGTITILAALIDFLTLLFPPNFSNRGWLLATITSLVDRGIVPLVGIALVFTGFWIDTNIGRPVRRNSLALDARFWTCLLACLLGLVFLFTTVVHPINVRLQSRDALTQVDADAEEATAELQGRLSADIAQRKAQLDALLQNEEQLQAEVASGNLDEAQLAQLERFRNNPQELDSFLTSQATEAEEQIKIRIGEQQKETTEQLRAEALKATVRVTLSSLLLAFGYTFIGWSGLRRLLAMVS